MHQQKAWSLPEQAFKLDHGYSPGQKGPSDRNTDKLASTPPRLAAISASSAGLPFSEHFLIPPRCCIGSSVVMSKSTLLQQPPNVTS
jgi:hypothetical protein